MQISWHEFGQTALRPRDDTKISYTDAVARAREKSFGKILLRLEREREGRASILPLPFSFSVGQHDRQTIGVREGNIKMETSKR